MSDGSYARTRLSVPTRVTGAPAAVLQRACACGQHTIAGGECGECKKNVKTLRRKTHGLPEVGAATSLVHEVLATAGRPMEPSTRSLFERSFRRDFSGVRIHTDNKAAASARSVDADAYTVGTHLVFDEGQYEPLTPAGQRTIAHELAHVVQQSSQSPAQEGEVLTIGSSADPHEREANKAAESVVAAEALEVPLTDTRSEGSPLQKKDKDTGKAANKGTSGPKTVGQPQPDVEPAVVWEQVEGRVISELEIKFIEIGRLAATRSKRQIKAVFEPYEDDLKASKLFIDIAGIVTGGAGNVPQQEGPGFAGGAFAQLANVLMAHLLDTDRVGDVKEGANLDVEELLAKMLTTDSPTYEQFQMAALTRISHEFYDWWGSEEHKDRVSERIAEWMWADEARKMYSVSSPEGTHILNYVHDVIAEQLEPVEAELKKIAASHRGKRLVAGTVGGAIAGGLVGFGVGASMGHAGLGTLIGGLGGAVLGLGGGWLANKLSAPAEKRKRTKSED